jgi:hypothetical protein
MSTEVAVPEGSSGTPTFQESLLREEEAERHLLKSLIRTILISLPISIAFFLLLVGLAISDDTEWYVWVGLGVGMGCIGAVLLGSLAGATLNAHKLDEVDSTSAHA